MKSILNWLEDWYVELCDGDWEHQYGIKIETIDNPGWEVSIDLIDTPLDGRPFVSVEINRDSREWVHCRLEDNRFKAYCGPGNLEEALACFKVWVEGESKSLRP
jgi:hypothetical protein